MTEIETLPQPAVSDGPIPIKEYRALSAWAMVALILGLLSGVVLASPLLGFVPLIAMVVGGLALRQIWLDSDHLSGRWMAVVPFILAPLFMGWGFSREFSRRERFFAHAHQFADEWLSILNRNEPYFAHQLRMPARDRLDPHMNFEVAYQRDEKATESFKMFQESSPVKELLAAAPDVEFQFEEFLRHKHEGFVDSVTMQYAVESPSIGKFRIWITVRRTYSNYIGRADWNISEVSTQKPRGSY